MKWRQIGRKDFPNWGFCDCRMIWSDSVGLLAPLPLHHRAKAEVFPSTVASVSCLCLVLMPESICSFWLPSSSVSQKTTYPQGNSCLWLLVVDGLVCFGTTWGRQHLGDTQIKTWDVCGIWPEMASEGCDVWHGERQKVKHRWMTSVPLVWEAFNSVIREAAKSYCWISPCAGIGQITVGSSKALTAKRLCWSHTALFSFSPQQILVTGGSPWDELPVARASPTARAPCPGTMRSCLPA